MVENVKNLKELLSQSSLNIIDCQNISLTQLNERVIKLETAKEFFSDILNSQLQTYSVIVGLLAAVAVGLYFLFIPRINKRKIDDAVKKEVKDVTDIVFKKMKEEFEKETLLLKQESERIKQSSEYQNSFLQADIARVFARQATSSKEYGVAFNWWIRTARFMSESGWDTKMIRMALNAAIQNSKLLTTKDEIELDRFNEHINIIAPNFEQEIKTLKDKVQELVSK